MDVETSFPFIGFQAFIGSSRWTGGCRPHRPKEGRGATFYGLLEFFFHSMTGSRKALAPALALALALLHLILSPLSDE